MTASAGMSEVLARAEHLLRRASRGAEAARSTAPGRPWSEVVTPALLLDRAALERNLAAMPRGLPEGVDLRPHVKAHKCPQVARRQAALGAAGFCAATAWEVAVLAATGLDDLFLVNTVADPVRAAVLAELARDRLITVAADDPAQVGLLAAAARAAGTRIRLAIEVDTGMRRGGVASPDAASALAAVVAGEPGLELVGVTGYEGHCSLIDDVVERRTAHLDAMERLLAVSSRLERRGFACPVVSAGGTRTWRLTATTPGVTEIQAGTYALMDTFHAGIDGGFEPALTVAATVVSRHADRIVLDAGSKAIGDAERSVVTAHQARVVRADEEHLILDGPIVGRVRLGDRVRIVPGYAPSTVNNFDAYHVLDGDVVVDVWPIVPRGPGHHGLVDGTEPASHA